MTICDFSGGYNLIRTEVPERALEGIRKQFTANETPYGTFWFRSVTGGCKVATPYL